MTFNRCALLVAALLLGGAVTHAVQFGTSRSVNIGVYTAAQAARGEQVYKARCSTCHYQNEFTGNDFIRRWSGMPLFSLYEMITSTMPEDQPGSLPDQQYADVIAFFLGLNKYPTGGEELAGTAEAMKDTLMEARQ
jgi:alcohol dehydrogenase (cytochrome c)